jgi:uncharacterized protein (TIGR03086 family)
MNPLEALDVAAGGLETCLAALDAGDWSRPTPCDEWDVRFLVAHVVGGNRFATLVLDGSTVEKAMHEIMTERQLSDAPLVDFASSASEQQQRFRSQGALERTVSHPLGALTGARFLDLRILDLTLHTWDLARAVGTGHDLDHDLARLVLTIAETPSTDLGFGIVPLGRVEADAPVQERLLDLTGRDDAWHPPDPT